MTTINKRFIEASNLYTYSCILLFSIAFITCFGQEKAFAANDLSVVEKITNEFLNQSQSWAAKLEGSVKDLFKLLFTLQLVMLGMTAIMKRKAIEDVFSEIITSVIFGGFILACILNYAEWSEAIMGGMAEYAGLLNYDSSGIVTSPMAFGFKIFGNIIALAAMYSGFAIFEGLFYLFIGLIILLAFCFITIQIIYIKCEVFIAVGAGFILLGFGGCSIFKDYAINLMRYILSVGFKLYILYIVLGLGFSFLDQLSAPITELETGSLAVTLVCSIILLTLSKALPDVAAGIIQGAHVSSGNPIQTAKQVSTMGGIATMATGRTINTARHALKTAKSGGASGVGGMAIGAARAAWSAHTQAKAERPTTTTGAINSKLAAIHAENKMRLDKRKKG